ncbi:MAG: SPFH domain-containing protein [Eubacteriales bacterium]|nr:SPFH domain-containing protein [Eubacteriales bacterium]
MGLILAAGASLSSVLGDQWKDYFYCSEMPTDVLVRKGEHHHGKSGLLNRGGNDNIITNSSTIVVNEGQCMIIVDQGAIVDICAEPGAYTYDTSTEASVFSGSLGKGIKESFKKFAARLAYGGVTAHDQRVYYFNTKNIVGNKYGTASPVPFRVVDANIGLDLDISIRCFGEYVYKLTDPILFYKNICGNVDRDYTRDKIDDQLKSELLTALQPAFARISDQGIRYSSLPGHTRELSEALNTELSSTWGQVYGIEIVTCGVSSVKASEQDEQAIKDLQLGRAAGSNAATAAGITIQANAQAMKDAAKNANGAMMGFAGMGMAQQAGGINVGELFQQAQAQQAQQPAQQQAQGAAAGWTCSCGQTGNKGKFCSNCGSPKPAEPEAWTCPSCGHSANKGKFCSNCGSPRPADNGPWTCPECGETGNTGKFCAGCGKPRP